MREHTLVPKVAIPRIEAPVTKKTQEQPKRRNWGRSECKVCNETFRTKKLLSVIKSIFPLGSLDKIDKYRMIVASGHD